MAWEIVKVPTSTRGRTTPFASIGCGKLSLSAAACALVPNYEEFSYALLRRDRVNNHLRIGVQFLKEAIPDSIRLSRQRRPNGDLIAGVDIRNAKVLEGLFGLAVTANKITRYDVRADSTFENFLIIFAE